MSTLQGEHKAKTRTMFHANPVLNRLSKVNERAEGNTATYAGIASKTTFFLAITVLGMIAQLLVRAALASEPVWQSFELFEKFTVTLGRTETMVMVGVTVIGFIAELLGIFARRTIPVTGSIYSACQGYVISFIVFSVLKGYEYLGLEALLITVAVIAAMSWLYTSGVIRGGEKYRAVMLTLVLGSIALGLLSFIGSLIPATRPFVQAMTQNPVIALEHVETLVQTQWHELTHSQLAECILRILEENPAASPATIVSAVTAQYPRAAGLLTSSSFDDAGNVRDIARFLVEELEIGDMEQSLAAMNAQLKSPEIVDDDAAKAASQFLRSMLLPPVKSNFPIHYDSMDGEIWQSEVISIPTNRTARTAVPPRTAAGRRRRSGSRGPARCPGRRGARPARR